MSFIELTIFFIFVVPISFLLCFLGICITYIQISDKEKENRNKKENSTVK